MSVSSLPPDIDFLLGWRFNTYLMKIALILDEEKERKKKTVNEEDGFGFTH